ncbi:MAG: type IV toxin-antitoxin system AbiEi family antitoxin [Deltaproteobacteria bacterium]|nr:type IV toxin-antitoxin system AbiEi family antitoxin [Deltaproteobacteria bacterium]
MMTSQKTAKINQVFQKWPKGTVATQTWLNQLGVSSKLANWHVGSGWLTRFGARAFTHPGDQVGWQGGLYALQTQLGMTVHVGGRTALELQGRSHFVPLGRQKKVILVSDQPEQLPAWFRNHQWEAILEHRCLSLFKHVPDEAATKLDCGGFKVIMSNAERAIMEQMHLTRSNDDIEHAYKLMEGLSTLRPNVAQVLLENCRSAKAKRLFLWSAETAGHAWFGRLNSARVRLGKGKRQIYKGGQFNQHYQITVPKLEELPSV